MEKKISVIIPIYNTASYLPQCLGSVLAQSYQNLEIFCVDDGSTDDSGAVCDQFAQRDSRIKILYQENRGKSAACNRALELCTGSYISIIDSDDWLEPDMYRVLVRKLEQAADIDIAVCGFWQDSEKESRLMVNTTPVPEIPMEMRAFLRYIYERDMYRGVASYLWNRIFRRELLERGESVRFDETLRVGEDVVFSAQCYLRARQIIYTGEARYHYRQHAASLMHNKAARVQNFGSCRAYEQVIHLFSVAGIDPAILDFLKRFYVYHAGVLLEYLLDGIQAISGKADQRYLLENIRRYLPDYIRMNPANPERIHWIEKLLQQAEEE